jgi:muramoyltetrapeptide carboxypeptidase
MLKLSALLLLCAFVFKLVAEPISTEYPAALHKGDTVGLVSSASRAPFDQDIEFAKERLQALGLHVVLGKYVYRRDGYFAGNDQQRAEDLNAMFANPNVKAIFEVRGGWGSARILPYLNYSLIKQHPKILVGFSDITSLLLAIHKKTGLVTFHGPLGIEPWPPFTVNYLHRVIFNGDKVMFKNPVFVPSNDLIQTADRTQLIYPGQANGELIGGNLSVLVALLGTPYEPDWQGKILFIEDVGETNYQIDRLLAQLQLAGVFTKIHGLVFGQCTKCGAANGSYGTFTLKQILQHYAKAAKIPTYMGAMIGHTPEIFTLPEGVRVSMNANQATITLLHSAVITE